MAAAPIPIVALLMPERPEAVGLARFGETEADVTPAVAGRGLGLAFEVLKRAVRTPIFWLLFGTYFISGLTTNGLVRETTGTYQPAFMVAGVLGPCCSRAREQARSRR